MEWHQEWLEGDAVDSSKLEALLRARKAGEADFLLVDVREPWEYEAGHIPGVDLLRPTSAFRDWAGTLADEAEGKPIILTCRTASRTAQLQRILQRMGIPGVINHLGGIVSWRGDIEKGAYQE